MEVNFVPGVESITILEADAQGNLVKKEVVKNADRKSRTTKEARSVERYLKRMLKGNGVFVDEYLALHEQSADTEKDGWIKDFNKNIVKAAKKSFKKKNQDEYHL